MRGSSPGEVLNAYLAEVRRVLGCLGHIDVRGDRFTGADLSHTLYVNHGRPIELAGSVAAFRLRVRQRYTFRQDLSAGRRESWQIRVLEYAYTLLQAGPTDSSRATMAFHWHPEADVTPPHMHVYSTVCTDPVIANSHIPSGHVGLPDVVEYLLRDWRVEASLPEAVLRGILSGAREHLMDTLP